jgi:uncharacterized protein
VGGGLSASIALRYRQGIIARWFNLPAAHHSVKVRRNILVSGSDGTPLATDVYAPRAPGSFPTILIRTPYGKALAPAFHARRFAERGYNVVVQDVRGRFGSGGVFEPFIHEEDDGAATVSWLVKQAWFNGKLGTWGQSYLAYTQWALVMSRPDAVTTLFPSLPSARGPFIGQVDDAQLLELPLRWMLVLDALRYMPGGQGVFAPWRAALRVSTIGQDIALADAFNHIPLSECDTLVLGSELPYYQQLISGPAPVRWQQADYQGRLGAITQPIHLLGGWYDFMLGDMLRAYDELRGGGQNPYLTIGPWHHVHPEISRVTLREAVHWYDAQLKGKFAQLRPKPVRVYVMGAGRWQDFARWPPPARPLHLFLQDGFGLSADIPSFEEASDDFIYDPHDPTPAVGGALFFSGAGQRDNRALESRSDVLAYTTDSLDRELVVIGPVWARLYFSLSQHYADIFVKLCDVRPDGSSLNVCDGIVRLYPGKAQMTADGHLVVDIDMWATAYRFAPGHAIRLQVSGGAHPRFARNPGIGNEPRSPAEMIAVRHTIHHGAQWPSALVLPVVLPVP